MKHVLVDNQKSVVINPFIMDEEGGNQTAVVVADEVNEILDTWMQLDPARRGYRYGNSDGTSVVILMWVAGDSLGVDELEPFWSPKYGTINGYSLHALKNSLPEDAIRYGSDIDEEEL